MAKDITWTILTDGRKDLIERTIPSWEQNVAGQFNGKFIIDDSGDPGYREWLAKTFKNFEIVPVKKQRSGYINAMRKVFEVARSNGNPYIFHLEDDFVLNKPVNLNDLSHVLDKKNYLTQISLLRQPWYEVEIEAGGVLQVFKKQRKRIYAKRMGDKQWLEHRFFWTCNPSVFPLWVAEREWPKGGFSEAKFGMELFENPDLWSGVWGRLNTPYYIEHIGSYQNGGSY